MRPIHLPVPGLFLSLSLSSDLFIKGIHSPDHSPSLFTISINQSSSPNLFTSSHPFVYRSPYMRPGMEQLQQSNLCCTPTPAFTIILNIASSFRSSLGSIIIYLNIQFITSTLDCSHFCFFHSSFFAIMFKKKVSFSLLCAENRGSDNMML